MSKTVVLDKTELRRLWYLLITQTYYYGVRMFGKPNFNYETKRRN